MHYIVLYPQAQSGDRIVTIDYVTSLHPMCYKMYHYVAGMHICTSYIATVTPEDLWKGTKTVLLEVARETIDSSSRKKMDI